MQSLQHFCLREQQPALINTLVPWLPSYSLWLIFFLIKQAFWFCPLRSFMSYWVKYNNKKWPTRWQLLSGFVFNLYYNHITVLENDTIEALISTFFLQYSYILVSFHSLWKWIVEKMHKLFTLNLYLGLAVPLLLCKNLMAKKYHNTWNLSSNF